MYVALQSASPLPLSLVSLTFTCLPLSIFNGPLWEHVLSETNKSDWTGSGTYSKMLCENLLYQSRHAKVRVGRAGSLAFGERTVPARREPSVRKWRPGLVRIVAKPWCLLPCVFPFPFLYLGSICSPNGLKPSDCAVVWQTYESQLWCPSSLETATSSTMRVTLCRSKRYEFSIWQLRWVCHRLLFLTFEALETIWNRASRCRNV